MLTEFYFWMSLGGVIGGALTALVSPLVFKEIIEYPLALGLVCLLRPGEAPRSARMMALLAAAVAIPLISRWRRSISWRRCRCRCG